MFGLAREFRVSQEAEDAQPVVCRYEDHTLLHQPVTGVKRCRRRAILQAAAIDPDHDCQLLPFFGNGDPDVQVETIFTYRLWWCVGWIRSVLHADRRDPLGLPHSGPRT